MAVEFGDDVDEGEDEEDNRGSVPVEEAARCRESHDPGIRITVEREKVDMS